MALKLSLKRRVFLIDRDAHLDENLFRLKLKIGKGGGSAKQRVSSNLHSFRLKLSDLISD